MTDDELAAKLKLGMNVRLPGGKLGKIADAPYYAESLKAWCVCVWTTNPHERKQYWDGWTSLPCTGITIIEEGPSGSLGYEPWWTKY